MSLLLKLNAIANVFLPVILTFFNVFFVALSDNANDAIMNSLALFFIMELDDLVVPTDWDEEKILDELAINTHDYVMEGMEGSTRAAPRTIK